MTPHCYDCEQPCRTVVLRVDTDGDGRPLYEDRSRCCRAEVYEAEVVEDEEADAQ